MPPGRASLSPQSPAPSRRGRASRLLFRPRWAGRFRVVNGIALETPFLIQLRPELLHQFDLQSREAAFSRPRTWELVSNVVHLGRAIDDPAAVLLPDMAAPAAGRIVERDDLVVLLDQQAEQHRRRQCDSRRRDKHPSAPPPVSLDPSVKIGGMNPDPVLDLAGAVGGLRIVQQALGPQERPHLSFGQAIGGSGDAPVGLRLRLDGIRWLSASACAQHARGMGTE